MKKQGFVAFILLCVCFLGMGFHHHLMWGWRVGELEFFDRPMLLVVGFFILFGAYLTKRETEKVMLLRRWCIGVCVGSVVLLQETFRMGWMGGKEGWCTLLLLAGLGGGELMICGRALLSSQKTIERKKVFVGISFVILFVLPTFSIPYVGVIPSAIACCLFVALSSWFVSKPVWTISWTVFFLFPCACFLGMGIFSSGVGLGTPSYFVVDIEAVGKNSYKLESANRLDQFLVRENQQLVFVSTETRRWSEVLVHPLMSSSPQIRRVLLLGGEEGFVLQELLHYPNVQQVDLWTERTSQVDFFKKQRLLSQLHQNSFLDPRVRVFGFHSRVDMEKAFSRFQGRYDGVVATMIPSKLLLEGVLKKTTKGAWVSIFMGNLLPLKRFACALRMLQQAGWHISPYHTGGTGVSWGFVMAKRDGLFALHWWRQLVLEPGLQYLHQAMIPALFTFPKDRSWQRYTGAACER